MKKKAIALAVGAMCVAPAAQSQIMFGNDTIGTVQLYGKLYPQYQWGTSKGATQPGSSVSTLHNTGEALPTGPAITDNGSRLAIGSQNTYLGFRGERKLGNAGLKGIWQVEQSIEIDTGTGLFSSRNSFVGLTHRHGTVKLGNMDTIYKEYGDKFSMFGISSGNFVSSSNILSSNGLGGAGSFNIRRANSVQLESGQYAGFQAGFQYGPDEAKGNAGNNLNASLYSYGVKWESGPIYLSIQQEIHYDTFGGSANLPATTLANAATAGAHSKDVGTRFSAEYRMGGHRIVGDIARLDYKDSGQATGLRFESYKKTAWTLGWDARWGDTWRTAIQYGQGGEGSCVLTGGASCSTNGLKGTMLNGGVAFNFDRQTFLYVIASKMTNGVSAAYDNWANGSPQRGADITQAAIGISYTF